MTRPNFELVKWLALVLMVGDHVNKALYGGDLPMVTELARVVLPLFAMVLGFNMATVDAEARTRTLHRLVMWGALAQPVYMLAFGHGLLPLNILLALAAAVLCVEQMQRGSFLLAALTFCAAGLLVEGAWASLGIVLATWASVRNGGVVSAISLGFAFGLLVIMTGAWYPVAALPLFVLLANLPVPLPRASRFFYAFYPGHLAALAVVALPYTV